MKIRNIIIFILMIMVLNILIVDVKASTGKVVTETARLRKKPTTDSVILDQLDRGAKVEVIKKEENWYKVKAKTSQGELLGYISSDLIEVKKEEVDQKAENKLEEKLKEKKELEESKVEEQKLEEKVENLVEKNDTNIVIQNNSDIEIVKNEEYELSKGINVKILPLINCKDKIELTEKVKVDKIVNDWIKIYNDNDCGWVRKQAFKKCLKIMENLQKPVEKVEEPKQENVVPKVEPKKPNEEPKKEEPKKEETLNKFGYVKTEGLRVREKATTDSKEIDSLKFNDKVEIIGKEGKWYKIKIKDEIGYVSAKYISDTKVPDVTSRNGDSIRNDIPVITPQEEVKKENPKKEEPKKEETKDNGNSVTGVKVVEYAKTFLGTKYVSGGTSPKKGFDCSGYTQYVYKHFGISLNRTSGGQKNNGKSVEKSNLQLGDIVLFNNDANTKIGHVGIYVGNGNFIHASNPKDGVKITSLSTGYYKTRYVGARRVI